MAATAVGATALLPQAELARLAQALARYLGGRKIAATSTRMAGRRAGQGLDFLDFRDYQPGDDFRSIDWRVSARVGGTQVRRYSGELASDWYLCLDGSASMAAGGGDKWLQAQRLTAAFAYVLLYLGHRVALLQFSDEVDALCPPGRGHGQYARLLATLEQHPPPASGAGSRLDCCRQFLGRRNPVLVISDFLVADGMLGSLVEWPAQRELHLLQVSSPGDLALPEGDEFWLRDVETGAGAVAVDRRRAEGLARARYSALQQRLAAWSESRHIAYSACDPNEAWREVLLRHFLRV